MFGWTSTLATPVFWSHCSFCRLLCWHHSYGVAVFVEPCCIVFKHQRVSRTNHTLSLFYYSCLPALDRGLCRDGILFWRQRLVLKWTTGQSFPASLPTSLAAILVYFFSIFLAFPHSLPFKTLLLGKACSVSTPPWCLVFWFAVCHSAAFFFSLPSLLQQSKAIQYNPRLSAEAVLLLFASAEPYTPKEVNEMWTPTF